LFVFPIAVWPFVKKPCHVRRGAAPLFGLFLSQAADKAASVPILGDLDKGEQI
jgi:hypothetical protein